MISQLKRSFFPLFFLMVAVGSYAGILLEDLDLFPMESGNAEISEFTNEPPGPIVEAGVLPVSGLLVPCTDCTEPYSVGTGECQDFDGDGVANKCDIDDDNDGILDVRELSPCSVTLTYSDPLMGRDRVSGGNANRDFVFAPGDNTMPKDWSLTLTFDVPKRVIIESTVGDQSYARKGEVVVGGVAKSYDVPIGSFATLSHSPSSGSTSYTVEFKPGTVSTHATLTQLVIRDADYGHALIKFDFGLTTSPVAAGYVAAYAASSGSTYTSTNCQDKSIDGDGLFNRFDRDSDGDRCTDAMEAGVISYIEGTAGAVYSRGNVVNADLSFSHPEAVAGPGASNAAVYGNNGFYNSIESNDTGTAAYSKTGGYTTYGDVINPAVATCICYKVPVTEGTALVPLHGTTTLSRSEATMNPSEWLEPRTGSHLVLESKTKGFVITRIASPETDIATPVPGMVVYDTDDNCIKIYVDDTDQWQCFSIQTCNE